MNVAWGFLASKEVKSAGVGNIGLHDRTPFPQYIEADHEVTYIERSAFAWVQKYIRNFGGDPTKVTMWVEFPFISEEQLYMCLQDGVNPPDRYLWHIIFCSTAGRLRVCSMVL